VRVVIAPDKLKGTYAADEAAAALARGWRSLRPGDDLALVPLADGGEGTAAALLAARRGEWRTAAVHDAYGRPVDARWADLGGGGAALDVAEACGMWRVADVPPDPLRASSLGAGELIRAAIEGGARRVIVGVGGTATSDGGEGLRHGAGRIPADVELVAALDVDNPLLGPTGAAAVYGPQKGASPEQVEQLERRLAALGLTSAGRPGAGAGGGIGGMLMELGARAVPGAGLVAGEAGLDRALAGTQLCITAEGRIDAQTLRGKVVWEVVARCRTTGVRCVAVGGIVDSDAALALDKLSVRTLELGDLEAAGAELAASERG
jgi:glycerate kinase